MNDPITSDQGSISRLIASAQSGNENSLELLFQRCYRRLTNWARRELDPEKCRSFDSDDIVIEAYESFCRGLQSGQYSDLADRHGLFALLSTIAIRKAINRIEFENAEKRGGGRIHGHSIFANDSDSGAESLGDQPVPDPGLTPRDQAILDDEFDYFVHLVPDHLKEIAGQLLLGHTPREIARELGCSTRSIELKRNQIRALWLQPL